MPKISVITVCRNREKTIGKALDSVLRQTCPPSEYIIADGASSDSTMAIVNSYKSRLEAKSINCTFVSKPDKGMYYAMNKAIALASGEWLHFLNSDDWYFEAATLEKVLNILRTTGADIVYGDMVLYSAKDGAMCGRGNVKPAENIRRDLRESCCVQQPATIYRKTVFQNRLFDTSFRVTADYEHFLYLADRGVTFEYHPVALTGFLFGEGLSTTNSEAMLIDYIRVQLRYGIFNRLLCEQISRLLAQKKRRIAHSLILILKRVFRG